MHTKEKPCTVEDLKSVQFDAMISQDEAQKIINNVRECVPVLSLSIFALTRSKSFLVDRFKGDKDGEEALFSLINSTINLKKEISNLAEALDYVSTRLLCVAVAIAGDNATNTEINHMAEKNDNAVKSIEDCIETLKNARSASAGDAVYLLKASNALKDILAEIREAKAIARGH